MRNYKYDLLQLILQGKIDEKRKAICGLTTKLLFEAVKKKTTNQQLPPSDTLD